VTTTQFWNDVFSHSGEALVMEEGLQLAANEAARYFGPLHGKRLIDLGCGEGATSLFFARRGAEVIGIDQSEVAISKLTRYCRANGVDNLQPVVGDVYDIPARGPVDFIFGSMILHHVDPFDSFAAVLHETVQRGGRCFFFENNSASNALMWFRSHVVGKFGVPKYGDREEHPLAPNEIEVLRNYFGVRQVFPYLLFFRLASTYLFRRRLTGVCGWLDRAAYKIPAARKYSYRQYVYLERNN
jgi:2-polyprenyl-3-methyl-5-hydroxy-6-metoxy-1,4-benzoquinol methylase